MPPVSPQGSRGGLVAAVVVFTIWSVAATIFAIYQTVALSKSEETRTTMVLRNKEIYSNTTSDEYRAMLDELHNGSNPDLDDHTVLGDAIYHMDQLSKAIDGSRASTTNPSGSIDDAHQALTDASNKLKGLNIPQDADLVTAINALVDFADTQQTSAATASAQETESANKAVAQITADASTIKQLQDNIDDLKAQMAKQQDMVQDASKIYGGDITGYQQQVDQEIAKYNETLHDMQTQLDGKDKELASAQSDLKKAMQKLDAHRPDPKIPIMRATDGQILSVASLDVVYIDVGAQNHVVPGMTFEVYDAKQGVPADAAGTDDENLPTGLGSIEVEQVDQLTSQCRITKLQPAQHIEQGDVIANLVYDKNTKYNFVVYGKFDLSQSGRPNDNDTAKIKALVTQWGGAIQRDIDVDTDFVVMGMEPKVDAFTDDELQDPFNVVTKRNEEQALKDYNAQIDKARELGIPIVNQNRFLYLVGYFDSAQR